MNILLIFTALLFVEPDPVVGRIKGDTIRMSELKREERFLAPGEIRFRKEMKFTDQQNRADWIQRLALRKIVADLAESNQYWQDPTLPEQMRQAARQWLVGEWATDFYGIQVTLPDPAVILKQLKESQVRIPDRLRLSHIFLRAEGEAAEAEAKAKLEGWRKEITSLQTFGEYAAKYSDSQTRRKSGRLGFLHRGMLPAEVETILYPLAAGTISPPIRFRGGYHLFYVEVNSPSHLMPVEPQVPREVAKLREALREDCRKKALTLAATQFPATRKNAADGAWPDLTVGDWSISATVLAQVYGGERGFEESRLEKLIETEQLFQAAMAQAPTWMDADRKQRLTEVRQDVLVLDYFQRQAAARLAALPEPGEADLKATIESAPRTYMKRRALELQLLSVSLTPKADPMDTFNQLSDMADAIQSGKLGFDAAIAALGGDAEQEHVPLMDTLGLAGKLGPPVFEEVAKLSPGQVTKPIQDLGKLWLVKLIAQENARPMSPEEAYPIARRKWFAAQRRTVEAELANRTLSEFQFEILAPAEADEKGPVHVKQP